MTKTIGDAYASLATPAPATNCYVHTWRETGLQCTACQRPICAACFVPAAVGQLCRGCARQRRPANYQVPASTLLVIVPATILICAAVTGLIVWLLMATPLLPLYLTFFAAPFAADLLVRCLDRLSRAKRGRTMQQAVGWSIGLGAAPCLLLSLLAGDILVPVMLSVFVAIVIVRVNAQLH